MLKSLLGRKIGMTQIFSENGKVIPVTVLEVGPCTVTYLKTKSRDGYDAVQIGFGSKKTKNVNRAELGHLGHKLEVLEAQRKKTQSKRAQEREEARAKGNTSALELAADETETQTSTSESPKRGIVRGAASLGPFETLKEVQAQPGASVKIGDVVNVDIFKTGELVDVVGVSKGKGFTGVMKRHGFHGGNRTHGQSDRLRAPGSIGAGTTPGRVFKGMRMAGRSGGEQITVKKLEVFQANSEKKILVIKGSVPGPNGTIVQIKKQEAL